MNKLFCIILIFYNCVSFAQQKDYLQYYDWINNAEENFFLKDNYDSAKYYYNKAFDNYDFCFARDCMTAMEIAAFKNDIPSLLKYFKKGVKNGLKVNDMKELVVVTEDALQKVEVFRNILSNAKYLSYLNGIYKDNRSSYLKRLNVPGMLKMNELFLRDQISKNNKEKEIPGYPEFLFKEGMFEPIYDSLIATVGFPGERLIGIDDSTTLTELGFPDKELLYVFDKYYAGNGRDISAFRVNRLQFTPQHAILSNNRAIIPLLHHSCSYRHFLPVWQQEIAKGNIHPREAAYTYDFIKGHYSEQQSCNYFEDGKPFFYVAFSDKPEYCNDKASVNAERAKLHIGLIEVDIAKRAFELKNNLQLFFGEFFY